MIKLEMVLVFSVLFYLPTSSQEPPGLAIDEIFALGQKGLDTGIPIQESDRTTCHALLQKKDPKILAAAIEATGKLGGEECAKKVTPFLKHESSKVRIEAAFALYRSCWVPHRWRNDVKEATPLPKESIDALIQAFEDPEADVRWAAVYALSRYGDERAIEPLLARLKDKNEWVRIFAVRAIGLSKKKEVASKLKEIFSDRNLRVRVEVIQAMARLKAHDQLPPEAEKDHSFHVRAAYATALGDSDDPNAEKSLLRMTTSDPSTTVVTASIDSRAQSLGKKSRKELLQFLKDKQYQIRMTAATAAKHLKQEGIDVFKAALQHKDLRVVAAALQAMEEIEGVEELIIPFLKHEDMAVRGSAMTAFKKREHKDKSRLLTDLYNASSGHKFIELRGEIAQTIDDNTLLLKIAEEDPIAYVREQAIKALQKKNIHSKGSLTKPDPGHPIVAKKYETDPIIILETDKGMIEIKCLAKEAPLHVTMFVTNVEKKFYDGLNWHRVATNFVIQGGDPRGDGWGDDGYHLPDEINRVRYTRGTVGMPKWRKDTGGCQIFITQTPTPHLDGNYTVFGQVVAGLDVIDKIEIGDKIKRAYRK